MCTVKHVPRENDRSELRRWLAGVAEIGAAVTRQEPLEPLLDHVARTACDLLDYDFCAVFLPDPARSSLAIRGYHGLSPDYVARVNAEHPILLGPAGDGEAPTSRAFRTASVVALGDIADEPQFGPWGGVAQEQGYRALVSVPLLLAGDVVGTLNCYRRDPHRFSAAELELVSTLATQVAIALVSAQLQASELATIEELRKAAEIHSQLTSTALRREGVEGVVRGLARLVGRAVLVEDVAGSVLASAPHPFTVRSSDDVDAHLADGSLVEVVSEGQALVVVGVAHEGGLVARVWCAAGLVDLSGLDVRALEHGGVVAALELLRERTAAEVESRLRGSLVADLLAGDVDHRSLLERGRRMGHDLTTPYALIALGAGEADLRAVAPALHGVEPPPLATVHRGVVVLLWPEAAVRGGVAVSSDDVARSLAQQMARGGRRVVAAVTATIAPEELPGAFRTARGALALAAEGRQSGAVVIDLSDAALETLLLQLDDVEGLRRFALRVLGPVIGYDRARSTDLMSTCRTLLEHDLDRRAAAAVLHLHPNTVLQRMRRVEELTGLHLGSPRDVLELATALSVARIAGL